jgi:hypothetical protein
MKSIQEANQVGSLSDNQRLCPFIKEPGKDCYCINMNSNKVLFAIRFCGGKFEECRIYKGTMREKLRDAEKCSLY